MTGTRGLRTTGTSGFARCKKYNFVSHPGSKDSSDLIKKKKFLLSQPILGGQSVLGWRSAHTMDNLAYGQYAQVEHVSA